MRKFIARRLLAKFRQRYDYDTTYMETMLEKAPAAFWQFVKVQGPAAHRSKAPKEAYYAVKILAASAEDCGPCTQLCVDMAREAGVSDAQIEAVVTGAESAMSPATAAGFAFGRAMAYAPDQLPEAQCAVRDRWGDEALIELAMCFAIGRVFPSTKTGMGLGEECRLVQIDHRPLRVLRAAG